MSGNKWLDVIESIDTNAAYIEKVPAGWNTITQIVEQSKKPKSSIAPVIEIGVKNGLIEKRTFKIKCGTSIRPVNHYKTIRKAK